MINCSTPDYFSQVRDGKVASLAGLALVAASLLAPDVARAEPYLAVRIGTNCSTCHVNPTGGGKRTEFGATYGQTTFVRE
jgi:class 3 adenylate cyclase